MAKRTRKQKERTSRKRQQDTSIQSTATVVKRDFEFSFSNQNLKNSSNIQNKKQEKSSQISSNELNRRDLAKSLILALGIFSLEAMIYWAWFK